MHTDEVRFFAELLQRDETCTRCLNIGSLCIRIVDENFHVEALQLFCDEMPDIAEADEPDLLLEHITDESSIRILLLPVSLFQFRMSTGDIAHLGKHEADRIVRYSMSIAPHRVEYGDPLLRRCRDIHVFHARTACPDDAAFLRSRHNLCIDRRMMRNDQLDIADVVENLFRRSSGRRAFLLHLAAQKPELLIARRFPIHTCDLYVPHDFLDGSLQALRREQRIPNHQSLHIVHLIQNG